MTAREFLQQIPNLEYRIKLKQEEITQLRTLATSITAPTDSEAVQTSGASDKVGNIVAKIVDLQDEINDMIDKLIDKRQECINVIEQIKSYKDLYYKVLHKRYIDDKSFDVIAEELHYNSDYMRQVEEKALESVEKILQTKKERF